MTDKAAIWKKRVGSWRASGKTARVFSAGRGWSPHTLVWWASRLRRGESAPRAGGGVRFAQVVRAPGTEQAPDAGAGAVVVESLEARLRVTIARGASRSTIKTVLEFVAERVSR
jgi:hypothetical protein